MLHKLGFKTEYYQNKFGHFLIMKVQIMICKKDNIHKAEYF